MKSSVFAVIAGIACMLVPMAVADPVRDAEYIVDKTNTQDMYDAAFEGMADLMLGNMQNELAKSGLSISDAGGATLVEMMVREMSGRMVEEMRVPLVDVYVDQLSPEALRAYKNFLQTEHGAELVAATPVIMAESTRMGETISEGLATEAVTLMLADMESGNWPPDTTETVKNELRTLFALPAN